MMQKIQRFGGAMFTPVLLFALSGIILGFSTIAQNEQILGSLANPDGTWFKVWDVIATGGWTVFNQMPLLFVVGLPIALAKKQNARCCMEAIVIYLMFNYFVSTILLHWGMNFGVDFAMETGSTSGLTLVAGIKTLDMGMMGAILISGIVVYLHNKYFDTDIPEIIGIFKGSTLIVAMGFFAMLPVALIVCIVWPVIQGGIQNMQVFMASSGVVGVWLYTFLERILIPTGLHHFVYSPFLYDAAIVPGGIFSYMASHLNEFAQSTQSLKELFPEGGFALHGLSKIFGCTGIALSFYVTAKPSKKKVVAGLLIPATLTAILCGITEPLEYTFLFIAPMLFAIHAVLAATLSATCYAFGVTGNFGGGLIEWTSLNFIPLMHNHWKTYLTLLVIGVCFTGIYFIVFKTLIEKLDLKTPGREDDTEDTKLFTKKDYKEKAAGGKASLAANILEGLGGKENIVDVSNCATRLRVSVKDPEQVQPDEYFKKIGAHGVVKNGDAIQVIVGLSVAMVRDDVERLL